MEEEKNDHEQKMQKMQREMEQVFEMKVNEKMQKLKDSEADVSNINTHFLSWLLISGLSYSFPNATTKWTRA